jgi:hypothetical protein
MGGSMKKNVMLFFCLSFLNIILVMAKQGEAKLPKEVQIRLTSDQGKSFKVVDLYKKYLLPHKLGFDGYSGFLQSKRDLYKDVKFSLVPQQVLRSPNLVVYFQDRDINKKVFLALLVNDKILFFNEKNKKLEVADAPEFLKEKLAFFSEFSKFQYALTQETDCNSFVENTMSPNREASEVDDSPESSASSFRTPLRGFFEGVRRYNTSDDSVLLPNERRNVSTREEENSASERSDFDDIF